MIHVYHIKDIAPLGNLRSDFVDVSRQSSGVTWQHKGQTLKIEAWGRGILRIRATLNSTFAPMSDALVRSEPSAADSKLDGQGVWIINGDIRACLSAQGHLRFYRRDEPEPFLSETWFDTDHDELYVPSRVFYPIGDQVYEINATFEAFDDERFYGLGQHKSGRLDQKGMVLDLYQRNGEITIPLLISSRLYGFLWNNPAVGRVELAVNQTRWYAKRARQLDYFVFTGDSYAALMSRYAELTGFAPQLPHWASGFWQSKLRYSSQEELLSVAREYRQRGLPLDAIVVDFFHWNHFGDWDWDQQHWPDPKAMVDELEAQGVKVVVSVWPNVSPKSANFEAMNNAGYLVRTVRGSSALFRFVDTYDDQGIDLHLYDATNPEAQRFVWQAIKRQHLDIGIENFWLDACEPSLTRREYDNLQFHRGNGEEIANLYPLVHTKAFYDGLTSEGSTEILSLSRSAWAGSQRYGTAVWSGDIPSTWESLRLQVVTGLNMMFSGIPWWTTDIGGFLYGDIHSEDFRELIVRWFQYGVFCPLFRLHGNRNPHYSQANLSASGDPNEVWSFGEEAYKVISGLLYFRERLRPYIEQQMHAASVSGLPPMRPLFFDYPHDENAYPITDQFLFGSDILVAPVLHMRQHKRRVYLPVGEQWHDIWSTDVHVGGQWVEVNAPLDVIPFFVRENSQLRITPDWFTPFDSEII
ncbi:MAG: glycoside hydrolase family 31 protein [Chloroflexi bacterium]|nr:glycoside hydrolase family 31 protein [Chloroflexota bacterium]